VFSPEEVDCVLAGRGESLRLFVTAEGNPTPASHSALGKLIPQLDVTNQDLVAGHTGRIDRFAGFLFVGHHAVACSLSVLRTTCRRYDATVLSSAFAASFNRASSVFSRSSVTRVRFSVFTLVVPSFKMARDHDGGVPIGVAKSVRFRANQLR